MTSYMNHDRQGNEPAVIVMPDGKAGWDWKPDIVIYHSPCDDGFGAAWAAWMRWGDTCEFFPTSYGKPAPDVRDKHVLIVDFSYPFDALVAMSWVAKSIAVLDHHKTAQADLERLPMFHGSIAALGQSYAISETQNTPPIAVHFNMEKSGARLAWEFCHPGAKVPMLIELIEDRDLWRFEIPQTKAFQLWLATQLVDFVAWREVHDVLQGEHGLTSIMAEAYAIERYQIALVGQIADQARWERINGLQVPVVGCPGKLASDVGHALLVKYEAAPFSATYFDKAGSRSYSLRSADNRHDVSAIAKRYGGGGHRNAAGFEVPLM